MATPIDLERFRAETPGVVNRVHLNNAGAGLMPLPVLQAMTDSEDTAAVAKELPYGTVTVTAVKGGLEIPAEQGGDSIIIAYAAVIVSLDDGKSG